MRFCATFSDKSSSQGLMKCWVFSPSITSTLEMVIGERHLNLIVSLNLGGSKTSAFWSGRVLPPIFIPAVSKTPFKKFRTKSSIGDEMNHSIWERNLIISPLISLLSLLIWEYVKNLKDRNPS